MKDATSLKKRPRAGITVSNLGTHLFSTDDCLVTVREAEEKAKLAKSSKKGKGKDKGPYGDENECIDGLLNALRDDGYQIDDFNAFMDA